MTLVMSPEAVWLNPPPLLHSPLDRTISRTLVGASIQPSLIPGPKILEKLELEIAFPR